MKKKSIIILTSVILATGALVASSFAFKSKNNINNSQDEKTLVTLVLDLGGANDQSFNQSALTGAENAARKHNIDIKFLESNNEGDYATNIETAIDMGSDLVIGVGFNLTEAIEKAAINYPEQQFAIIDGAFDSIPSNVKPLLFNESDAGYLTGLAAAKKSESDKFGFIGGFEVPAVINFRDGFERGIKEVNPNAKLYTQYANSFVDAAKGKAIAQSMHNQGIEIVMTAGGGVNHGVYEASIENQKLAIGVDMPQSYIAPEFILTSALKNVDLAVESTIDELVNGTFKGGEASVYDLSNNGVGYEKTPLLSDEIIDFIESKKPSIK